MTYERDLISFINREIMRGQGDDLDATTPLLELRVIDSISMVMLVGHIAATYGLKIPPESLTAANFQDVRSIAALVAGLADRSAASRA